MEISKNKNTAFAIRLNHALDIAHFPPKGRGRGTELAKLIGISNKGATKLVDGISTPKAETMSKIAKKLNIEFNWLATGEGLINEIPVFSNDQNFLWKEIPVITWERAASILENPLKKSEKDDFIRSDVGCGSYSYCLRMPEKDDSMMPGICPGDLIIIDPESSIESGNIVIIKWLKSNTVGCSQLLTYGNDKILKPKNNAYPSTTLSNDLSEVVFLGAAKQIIHNCL